MKKSEERNDMLKMMADIPYSIVPDWYGATKRALRLDVVTSRSGKSQPSMVWLCGGAFQQMNHHLWIPDMVWYAKRGFTVVSVEYRVGITGRWPNSLDDVWQALCFICREGEELGVDKDNLFIAGESAGGFLAASVGTGIRKKENFPNVSGCIDFYGITDLEKMEKFEKCRDLHSIDEYMGGGFEEEKEKYIMASPIGNITQLAAPFLLIHGGADKRVPCEQSTSMAEKLSEIHNEAEIHIVEGAGHGDEAIYQEKWRKIALDFMLCHVKY